MDVVRPTGDTIHTEFPIFLTDYDFLKQYKIPLIAGRAFSEQYVADSVSSLLISESAVKGLGFRSPNEAIGLVVGMYPLDAKIIGVFKDIHFKSLKDKIEPLTMRILADNYRLLSLEVQTANLQQTIGAVEKTWKELVPHRPLEYSFLDESFNRQYQTERKFGQVFGIFSAIAIVVACLGLFGLALFSVQQRTKEIGIRKVLGASAGSVAVLLSKEFVKHVLVAACIATPVAWIAMHDWLEGFAFKIEISWWMFAAAALLTLLIALLTVSFQAIKAAVANPVKSLRTE
jgi:putative ABC transport system permease protein